MRKENKVKQDKLKLYIQKRFFDFIKLSSIMGNVESEFKTVNNILSQDITSCCK